MAQTTQITIDNQTFPSFRSKLNESLSALNTLNSGTSRPSSAVAGTIWLDTTNATNPTLKFYDGADDISLATIDYTANTVNWLDSSVSLTSPVAVSGNASAGAEIRLPEDTDNGSNYVALKAADSIASDVTFTLPNADGTADQILKTDGSGNLSFVDASTGISWQSVQTTGFTASAGNAYPCNTTSAGFTVTLPVSPSAGDQVQLVDYAGTFDTNALVIDPNGNDIQGGTDNLQLTGEREGVTLTYIDATQGWISTSGINEGSNALEPTAYSVDFLVVAGGGSGGAGVGGVGGGGGGGAGGYRASTQTVNSGTVITVTVGDGGASPATGSATNDGSNSSISGSGLSTITSAGGGGGGGATTVTPTAGNNGGSGGGGQGTGGGSASGGTGNTPSTSPSQGNNGGTGSNSGASYGGGGGGGATATGSNGSGSAGGNGGNGTSSSITGSSVTRAGGGGGGTYSNNGTGGTGGSGGGGNGSNSTSVAGTSGTVNTGGGGGGGGSNPAAGQGGSNGGAGGKGVVILSVATSNYSGTTTGSPTVGTSGSNTILTFTGSGSYTA